LDITPIFNRELLTAARKKWPWQNRGFSAGILLTIVLATLGARYYWDKGLVSQHDSIARAAREAFLWMLVAHVVMIFGIFASRAVLSIADEKDRRTLDFLLATRLNNAEIVLGKLVACMTLLVLEFGAGLPIMLLLHPVGGIDLRLILLAYAGLLTTGFFMIALAIWVSTRASNARVAAGAAILWWIAWLIGPFVVSNVLPTLGLRLPGFALTANAWVLTSSPFGLVFKIGGGVRPSNGLTEAVASMSGLQVAGGALLVIWAIASLRSSYRLNVSCDSQSLAARLTRPGWRWRPKPPVGDDPILWREMNLARAGFLANLFGLLVYLGIYGSLGYVTYFFARPALTEVWRHGYTSGITSAERPEWNLMIRFFMSGYGVDPPPDVARTELNLYLRNITTPLIFLITLVAAGMATEGIISERARETWGSLIATPLTAREILRSKMLATLWRVRVLLATVLGLWTIGLATGAIHPLGFVVSVLVLAALMWFMLAFGTYISVGAKDMAAATGPTMGLVLLMTVWGALPFLLPVRMSSVVLGSGSPPLVAFLSLASYRDVRNAVRYPVYPLLQWMHLATGEGPRWVALTCLMGIIIPSVAGFYLWRYSLTNFDRLIGRPWKMTPAATERLAHAPAAVT
jgi:ABC-type Na+ efflux pump permease subunit